MSSIFSSAIPTWPSALAAVVTPGDEGVEVYHEMLSDSWFVRHSIIVCTLLLILLACLLIRRRRRTMEIFSNAGGKVHIAHTALAELVENVAREYGVVSRPRAYFARRSGKLEVWVRLKISAGQRLPHFTSALQTRITEALREAFGIVDLGGVHIIVTGYTGTPVLPEVSSVPYHGAAPEKPAKPAPTAPRPDEDYFGMH